MDTSDTDNRRFSYPTATPADEDQQLLSPNFRTSLPAHNQSEMDLNENRIDMEADLNRKKSSDDSIGLFDDSIEAPKPHNHFRSNLKLVDVNRLFCSACGASISSSNLAESW